jgi:hypothetical protein
MALHDEALFVGTDLAAEVGTDFVCVYVLCWLRGRQGPTSL